MKAPSRIFLIENLGLTKGQAETVRFFIHRDKIKKALELTNKFLDAHGVESLWPEYPTFYYVNKGDTYSTTLCYTGKSLYVGSWGSWVETHDPVDNDGSNPKDQKYWIGAEI